MVQPEWQLRGDMAATCRLISRLNGHDTFEGSFAHFSLALGDGRYLVAPAGVPFAAMRASTILVVDRDGKLLRGSGVVGSEIVGAITAAQVDEIAEVKKNDLNAASAEAAARIIAGTARSMGIEVKG